MTTSVDGLKELVREMIDHYYKGFGITMMGIQDNAEAYLHPRLPDKSTYQERAYRWYREIEAVYDTIPFDDLEGRNEFQPLFRIRELLPEFKSRLDEIFLGDSDLRQLINTSSEIGRIGEQYWENVLSLLRRINAEDPEFAITLTDHKGHTWEFRGARHQKLTEPLFSQPVDVYEGVVVAHLHSLRPDPDLVYVHTRDADFGLPRSLEDDLPVGKRLHIDVADGFPIKVRDLEGAVLQDFSLGVEYQTSDGIILVDLIVFILKYKLSSAIT